MSSMLAMDRFWRNNRILRSRVHGMDVREDHDKQSPTSISRDSMIGREGWVKTRLLGDIPLHEAIDQILKERLGALFQVF
jgi:hypothetical protein